ncbi:chorismate lyase [Candidatus Pantoea multigeneris]|uniref:Chorismate pyruvate-lyase n=1 Tax=Candidatus Pantoea multigeneris TaxID=2608357 RepID=A0ABX0RDW2_9GAMM|nr:chorismate lyase [Pantoea multigeneris]NIF22798.1 chorismate lyase [Pantoea multigeneris]
MPQDALTLLHALCWTGSAQPSTFTLDWLMEEDSMTQRFERHCQQVTVQPYREGFITSAELSEEERAQLPDEARFWLREIILSGDGVPWLAGRTLVPESTLDGPEAMLSQMGTRPLGRYLFSSSTLSRDFITIGQIDGLWGRRSRLRLSDKPFLLTELFLPAAPVYSQLSQGK